MSAVARHLKAQVKRVYGMGKAMVNINRHSVLTSTMLPNLHQETDVPQMKETKAWIDITFYWLRPLPAPPEETSSEKSFNNCNIITKEPLISPLV